MSNPFSHLRQQVKSCLEREAKLTPSQRRAHQWQFLTTINDVPYIVGKGGANTMFYQVGITGERHICDPWQMLETLSAWAGNKLSTYGICDRKKRFHYGMVPDLKDVLDQDAEEHVGLYIVGATHDGRMKRLYVSKSGLKGAKWVPFRPNKK